MNDKKKKDLLYEGLSDDLKPYYEKSDCCSLIVKFKKDKAEKQQEIERLNNIINELENTIANFIKKHTESYIDWKYDREIYLAENNVLQKLFDNYLDKLKKLKEDK